MEAIAYTLQAKRGKWSTGSLSGMKAKEVELPPPGKGEVTIAVEAIGLNFADIFAIWGLYGATPQGSFTPGLEYAGRVAAVGKGVGSVKEGDAVMGVTRFGAYATALNIDARYVLPLPKGWDMAEGCAYLVQVLTAYYGLLRLGDLQRGQAVLIHSAAGGVGIWANRIAKAYGAYTVGTVGSHHKLPLLKEEGYDKGIVRSPQFKKDLLGALEGRQLNLIMECIGGKIFRQGYEVLAQQGRAVVYGAARYGSVGNRPNYLRLLYQYLTRPKIDPQKMPEHNKSIMGFNLIWLYHRAELMHELLAEISELELGRPIIFQRFSFEDLHEAVRVFQSGSTVGKVVIAVGE
ncbi:zinc-binding dehydrogenase [Phaeodactylibacter luteus]|uniref:Zinc-binding dehydrogenase n=1 Tax=Phaeodactylibacter luteus TaxID=1564516 RepID=A0A5C6RLI9_9BACT|nr:zinc-binding dehydrogenase [Phaeodactylibacter luteus]TXB63097.1 zinc-binding dehydrogenase [Phaeodactylibacter luteus]